MATTEAEYQYWGDLAETFDEDTFYVVGASLSNDIKGWLQKQFSKADAVLELGCGTGIYSEAVAPLVRDLIATDVSEPMLRQARAKLGEHSNIRFQKQDAYNTSFGDSEFDVVLMVNLLHIVHDPALILQECSRVLGESGRVVAADVTSQGAPLMAAAQVGFRYMERWGRGPASNRNLSLDELARLMQEAGFRVEDQTLLGATVRAACVTGVQQGRPAPDE